MTPPSEGWRRQMQTGASSASWQPAGSPDLSRPASCCWLVCSCSLLDCPAFLQACRHTLARQSPVFIWHHLPLSLVRVRARVAQCAVLAWVDRQEPLQRDFHSSKSIYRGIQHCQEAPMRWHTTLPWPEPPCRPQWATAVPPPAATGASAQQHAERHARPAVLLEHGDCTEGEVVPAAGRVQQMARGGFPSR